MNYFERGTVARMHGPGRKVVIGYALVSIGILLAASGGTWDVTNHLLNKPETFFAPPHAVLYSGAASALAGAVLVVSASRSAGRFDWSSKLVMAGTVMLISAGPIDFVWHSAFGLDGLLSPPHSVLVSGMVTSSIAAAAGMVRSYPQIERSRILPAALVIVAMLPVWISVAGLVHMFSLPFSRTAYFDFNPDSNFAAVFATLGFPFVTAAVSYASWALAGRRFGVLSAAAAAFIFINTFTSIVPNDSLATTIPFYVVTVIPLVMADIILSKWRSARALLVAGAVAGIAFFMLYYPLITHTYNKVDAEKTVWASLTAVIYFEMIESVYPLVVVPAAAMGMLGAIASERMVHRAALASLR